MNLRQLHPLLERRRNEEQSAFTLVEVMVSIVLLAMLLLVLSSVTEAASRAWRDGQSRTDSFQSARTALEIITRELTPAVVDTRMQFVVAPGSTLTKLGAQNVAPESPVMLWMAPLGEGGKLHCVGYYLYRDTSRAFYRLKRIYIPPGDGENTSPYFPRTINQANPRDITLRTSSTDATWFTRKWNDAAFDEEDPGNTQAVVSTAADGVIAMWVQCVDLLGNPIPLLSKAANHPKSTLWYNSAAYFQVATTKPFESGRSFQYLAETKQSMKGNRVPATVELTVVTIDQRQLLKEGLQIPEQVNVYDSTGALDVSASVQLYQNQLQKSRIFTARTFSTRAQLVNGN